MTPANPVELKLLRARVNLLFKQPFFASLCLRLKLIPTNVFPRMATDGKRIAYNPAFVEAITPDEVEGVLAHEVMHCALGHHCRRGNRKKGRWNQAADYATNPILLANGLVLPEGALIKPDYEGLSAEQIYDLLEEEADGAAGLSADNSGAGTGLGSLGGSTGDRDSEDDDLTSPRVGGFGEVLDAVDDEGNPAGEGEANRQASEWAVAAQQALQAAKAQGHGTTDVERALLESRQSSQNWKAILRDFVAATMFSDYTWSPPNRRFIGAGLYLPSVHREGIGPLVIGVDTSGSITARELEQFAGEISAISDQAQPERIYVVYCDEAVTSTQEFGAFEPIDLKPKGGMGTDFRPVFEWVEEQTVHPACLIYLTDLYCDDYPAVPPAYPVLWVTNNSRRTPPFGETVKIVAE